MISVIIMSTREKKRAVLYIRCTERTRVRFKRFSAMFKSMDEALSFLLDAAEQMDLKPRRWL